MLLENFQGHFVTRMDSTDLKKSFNVSNPSFDRYNSVVMYFCILSYSHYVLLVIKTNLINVSNNINAEK